MTRVRTRRHLSRLLLLFSSTEVLHARHCLTLLLLGLTSLRTVLSCDERTRAHESRELDPAFPRSHVAVRRYPERRDLAAIPAASIPEWMRRKRGNGASSMVGGQSANDVVDDHRQPGDSSQGNRDSSAPPATRRTDDADQRSLSVIGADRRDGRVRFPKRESDRRSGDSPGNRRATGDGIVFHESMRQSRKSAEHRSQEYPVDGPALQVTRYRSSSSTREAEFQDDPNGVGGRQGSTILRGTRRGTGNFADGDDRQDATVEEAPIDQLRLSELPSVNHVVTRLTRSRRVDRNGDSYGTGLGTSINRASVRSAAQSGTGEAESGRAATKRRDHFAGGSRGNRGTAGFEATTRQTPSDIGSVYTLDNRRSDGAKRGSASYTSDYYAGDNFDLVANDSANSRANDGNVDVIVYDTIVDYADGGVASMEHRVDQVSEFGNRTGANSQNANDNISNHGGITEIRRADCRGGACSAAGDDNDNAPPIIGTRKLRNREDEDHRVGSERGSTATPGSDGDADTDVETEAPPFAGFDGSQKFPVKINRKSAPQKFDWRHFGPHKENVLEKTTLAWWYPSTADLPKSPSRDALHPRTRETNGKDDPRAEEAIGKQAEKRNGTHDESFGGPGTDPSSPAKSEAEPEGFAVTTDSDAEGTSRGPDAIDVTAKSTEKTNVTILGLFEMTHGTMPRPEGSSELEAAKLAVDRVNELDILKRFRLRLIYNDTKCDSGVAVDRFFHALYSTRKRHLMPFLLGTACSEVTETLAKIVPYWNVIQVSFGSTAPALSDSNEFPLFVRTVAPDSSHNPARIALIKHFGWDTVTALSQTGDMYSLAVNDLVTELEQANITCTATITFAENDYKEQLRTLKELDTRIIIGSFSSRLAQRVFCEAWKLGMHGGDYAWILPDDTITLLGMKGDWWHAGAGECSRSQLSQTMDGLIIVKSHAELVGDEISASGLTNAEFISELTDRSVTHSKFAEQTYDAVWAMALALAGTEVLLNRQNGSIAQYTHTRKDLAYHLLEQLKLQHFVGVSGPVSFNDADRVGITAFYQMMHGQDDIKRIAIYTPEDGKLIMNCPGCEATRWPGGQVPPARRVFRLRMVTVAPAAFLAVTCIASVGVTLALAFLAFNLHFRKHKNIKLSSPRLNNMAAVGCGLVYGAVILLGLDDATLPDSDGYYPTVCKARVYLLSAGFSLAFGSMFTKTYRVHRIFTRSRSGVVKNKLLQDTQLIFLICMLLVIDVVVVTLWVILDPMQRHLQNLTLEISPQDRGVVYQPQVEVCRSQHTNGWLGALYVYKGLLLVVGVYMAWETRHVKIPALNDSQYIGMSVYFVVITSGIVVVLANLMPDRATLAFVTITALILTSTTATLALLFLPQLANILAGERADPVVQSFGLKIECNTRRFVTDDKRELQYRVEVQNRVYRREMAQLELELARLEKQLAQEPTEASRTSSSASIPQRNPSIGGGLPLLLLSVLPPVIPRASWPSADSSGIRRGTVAFSSQPDLEPGDPRQSLADLYKLHRRRETEGPNRLGVFQRLFSLFGSRPSSRKTSTASFTGVASALRVHMGYIAGLMPGTKAASTCQVDAQGTHSPHARCGSGPIISITSEEDRRLSLGLRRKESSEPKVNFSLPPQVSTSQSSSREKIRGSPRFPHRIIPANSLSAIAQSTSISRPHRWHSMEDASKSKITQTTSRGSCSPNSDVWATSEVGVPFSELANTVRGRKPPDSLPLTITVDSKMSPIDVRLASDLRKLFRENDTRDPVSPAELKANGSSSSSSSSPKIVVGLPAKNDSTLEACREIAPNFRQEPTAHPSSPVISVVDTDNPGETINTDVVTVHVAGVPREEKRPTTV